MNLAQARCFAQCWITRTGSKEHNGPDQGPGDSNPKSL